MRKIFKHKKFTAVFTDEDGYFSLTGDVEGGSGACGDKISEIDPDFELLNKVHLSNKETGIPMHAWANAEFHFKNGDRDKALNSLALDDTPTERKLFEDWATAYNTLLKETPSLRNGADTRIGARHVEDLVEDFTAAKEAIEDFWHARVQDVYDLVDSIPSNLSGRFMDPYDNEGNIIEGYEDILEGFDEPEKAIALAQHEDCDVADVEENGQYYTAAGREYLVVPDEEADDLWDQDLENYIDECLEIPEQMKNYFDREAWKRDARIDGRGHSLGRYDGNEYEVTVDGTTYFIYRQ